MPMTDIPSVAVGIKPMKISADCLSRRMRELPIPVVTRIEDGRILIDMRTFEEEYTEEFVKMLKAAKVFSEKREAEAER